MTGVGVWYTSLLCKGEEWSGPGTVDIAFVTVVERRITTLYDGQGTGCPTSLYARTFKVVREIHYPDDIADEYTQKLYFVFRQYNGRSDTKTYPQYVASPEQ